jgi:hypothetical protein
MKTFKLASQFVLLVFLFWGTEQPLMAQSPAGIWRGQWYSQSTGHRGPMRANVRPRGDGTYSARFSGRFFVILPFTYRVDLMPAYPGSSTYYSNKKLGPIFGSYRMQTSFGSNAMSGQFQAAKDRGTVSMRRR